MSENREAMNRRHKTEVKDLQAMCPHEKTAWMPYMWAPGHYGGDVRVCGWCGKIVERKKGAGVQDVLHIKDHRPPEEE